MTIITSDEIFKYDSHGKLRTWFYRVDGDRWQTVHGLDEGAKTESAWTICTPKSQPTAELQAQFEAEAEMKKKLERDYHRTIEECDSPNFFKPMLAHPYEGTEIGDWASQRKFDGIRCIATAKGLFSRQGKRFFAAPHIEESLAPLFDQMPTLILDGELYNHELRDDFNKISSLVRKKNPTKGDIAESRRLMQYHVYDMPSAGGGFANRFVQLVRLPIFLVEQYDTRTDQLIYQGRMNQSSDGFIQLVETVFGHGHEALVEVYQGYVAEGYEGQMVRAPNGEYQQKRSKHLLKHKAFKDEEFKISRILKGVGAREGMAGAVEFILPNDHRLENGERPKAGLRGNEAFFRDLLARSAELEGTDVTVRFFDYTPAGIPRFPVATKFHEGERTL